MIVYIRLIGYWLRFIPLYGNVILMNFYCNVFKHVTALFVCGRRMGGQEQESNETTVGQPNRSSSNQTVFFPSFVWMKKILIRIVCVCVCAEYIWMAWWWPKGPFAILHCLYSLRITNSIFYARTLQWLAIFLSLVRCVNPFECIRIVHNIEPVDEAKSKHRVDNE